MNTHYPSLGEASTWDAEKAQHFKPWFSWNVAVALSYCPSPGLPVWSWGRLGLPGTDTQQVQWQEGQGSGSWLSPTTSRGADDLAVSCGLGFPVCTAGAAPGLWGS